jgi:AcrR family transcriptional regulator
MARWNNAVASATELKKLREDALYREAAKAFRRNGYHGTALEDIAEGLGISKPTLYHYVKNKRDLLYQCHLAAAEQALSTICPDKSLNGLERLRRTISRYVQSMIGEDSYSVVILEEKSLSPTQLTKVIHERDKFEGALVEMILKGQAEGLINPGEPRFAVFNVLGAVNWVTKWYRPGGPWSVEEVGEGIAGFVCRGLAAPGVGPIKGSRLFTPAI